MRITRCDTIAVDKTLKKTELNMRKGEKISERDYYIDSTTIRNRSLDGNRRGNKQLNTLKYGDIERGGYTTKLDWLSRKSTCPR